MSQRIEHSQAYHARQVMHHFDKIDLRKLKEEALDEDHAVKAFRKAEDLVMDIDDAMDAIQAVSEQDHDYFGDEHE